MRACHQAVETADYASNARLRRLMQAARRWRFVRVPGYSTTSLITGLFSPVFVRARRPAPHLTLPG
jgi:hypothetical protein